MYHLGVDLGGTNIAAGITDSDGNIIVKGSTKTKRHRAFLEIMKDLLALCDDLIKEAEIAAEDVKTIGIGTPGNISPDGKKVIYGNNIESFSGVDLSEVIKKHYPHMDMYLENDANAAAYAELLCGAAKDKKSVVMVTLGTGVGSGIIIDGKIFEGFNRAGGEIGHTVIEKDGVPCNCGRRGCWEQYASVTALSRITAEMIDDYPESIIHKMIHNDKSRISGITAFNAMRSNDACGKAIVEKYVEYIAIGVVNIINTFQPDMVILGGGISKEGDNIILPLREYAKKHAYAGDSEDLPHTKIVTTKMGNDAGIIGAALLYKQKK